MWKHHRKDGQENPTHINVFQSRHEGYKVKESSVLLLVKFRHIWLDWDGIARIKRIGIRRIVKNDHLKSEG